MHGRVIATDDFQREPALKLIKRHRRVPLRIVVAAIGHGTEGRARQHVHSAHQRPDQPLDVAAVMRRRHRPMDQLNPIFGGSARQRPGPEFAAVVDVNEIGQPGDRPLQVDPTRRQPRRLRRHSVMNSQCDGRRRRRLQAEVEPRHHPAGDVDRERQPGPLDRPAMHGVDHEKIDARMVDLNNLQRIFGAVLLRHRLQPVARRLSALAAGDELVTVDARHPRTHRFPRRRRQSARSA